MKQKKRLASILMLVVVFIVTACGSGESGSGSKVEGAQSNSFAPSDSGTDSGETVHVVWWHSMGGELGQAVDALVSKFNASRSDIQIEAIFQGSYDESLNKMRASMDTNEGPAIVQVYEIGSRFMIDSGVITPIQTFIDSENFDTSELEENILGYYSFDGQLYSMPFNTSNPILYYNKDMFRAAGLDPENPPGTFEEIMEASQKLTGDGKFGASFSVYGWFVEQFFANQGAEFVNNGNGRGDLATASLLNSEAGLKLAEWWKDMVDQGLALNLGRSTADTKTAFAAEQIAMTLDSTAALRGIVNSVGDKFEVGTGFLPKPADSGEGGVIVGGASLYILGNRPEAEQQAAWEFIKFLASPEVQAQWHVNTGYFPITKKAYDLDVVKQNMENYPQFQTAVNQLHATKLNAATKGAVMGVFPEARQIVENAMEEVLNGVRSPQEALDHAAADITERIEQYNRTIQ